MVARRTFLAMLALHGAHNLATQAPGAIRIDDASLKRLFSELQNDERRDLQRVRILVDGQERAESYFNGGGRAVLTDIRSAGKSITSLLVGIAIDKRLIPSVTTPLIRLLGVTGHADKARITLE